MKKAALAIFRPKKVQLKDIVSPKPSRAATKVLDGAVKRAYEDQQLTIRKAQAIRSS